jgi:hypothetical protein
MDNERDNAWLKSMGVSAEEYPAIAIDGCLSWTRQKLYEESAEKDRAILRVEFLEGEYKALKTENADLRSERNVFMVVATVLVLIVAYSAREFCKAGIY